MKKADRITPLFYKLSRGENLNSKETRRGFNLVGDNDEESYFFTALSMGIMAKGPTVEELYGFCLDRKDRVGVLKTNIPPANIIDLSGGGGDKIKTINVSTAASFVLATGGVFVAKQSAKAFTGFTGSRDILEAVGINMSLDKIDKNILSSLLEDFRLIFYNYASLAPEKFINFFRWRKKTVGIGLKYLIPWHIASFAYSPIPMENRVYGLASQQHMHLLAQVLQRLKYKKIMVVHGIDGLDEVSVVGKTKIIEIRDNEKKEYEMMPEELGVKTAKIREIATASKEENVSDFIKVLTGREHGPKRDLVAVNAGAGFYLVGKVKTLKEGTKLAIDILESGKAFKKLEQLVNFYKVFAS